MAKFNFDYEIGFWEGNPNFIGDKEFYNFFPFGDLHGEVLDVGCAVIPVDRYIKLNDDVKLILVDPLLQRYIETGKWENVFKGHEIVSDSFVSHDFCGRTFDGMVCLNVIDHFDTTDGFVSQCAKIIKPGGLLFLYYDIRDHEEINHMAVDEKKINDELRENFDAVKISTSPNPRYDSRLGAHRGVWKRK